MTIRACFTTLLLTLLTSVAAAQTAPASPAGTIAGTVQTYEVMPGDSLALVAAKFGVEPAVLARDNNLTTKARLKPGDTLTVDNRHVVPSGMHDGIVVNIPQRRLFLFRGGALVDSYPVAVGRSGWKTPTGEYSVIVKEVDPSWEVPKSIQAEMAREGKRVITRMAPGPDNPLGTRWIGVTSSIGIHGTNAPSSVFRYATHGCIRMSIENVEHLFEQIHEGDAVSIIYEPLLIARDGDELFVEVHPDPYRKGGVSRAALERRLAALGEDAAASHPDVAALLAKPVGRAVPVPASALTGGPR